MPTSAPNTDISQRANVGIGPYGAELNNNLPFLSVLQESSCKMSRFVVFYKKER